MQKHSIDHFNTQWKRLPYSWLIFWLLGIGWGIRYRNNIYCGEGTNNFSQFGVSTAAVKEHATRFRSFELIKYAQEWDFQQVTLPPGIWLTRHARGNGKVETSKKTILKKSYDDK